MTLGYLLDTSAVAVFELEQGIQRLRRAAGTERAIRLDKWLDQLLLVFSERVLAFDAHVGRLAGAMADEATAIGRHRGFLDIAIAATALAHDLVVVTANWRHFEPFGVQIRDQIELAASMHA